MKNDGIIISTSQNFSSARILFRCSLDCLIEASSCLIFWIVRFVSFVECSITERQTDREVLTRSVCVVEELRGETHKINRWPKRVTHKIRNQTTQTEIATQWTWQIYLDEWRRREHKLFSCELFTFSRMIAALLFLLNTLLSFFGT